MDRSADYIRRVGSTACSEGLSVIARPPTATQIMRHTQGPDYALPDPEFAASYLPHRPDEIAIERELLPEKSTMPRCAPSPPPIGRRILIETATSHSTKSPYPNSWPVVQRDRGPG